MIAQRLQDRRVLVSGGASGIGRAICLRLAHEGAQVWINYRTRESEAQALKIEIERLGVTPHLTQADISNPEQVETLLKNVAQSGGVNSLIHAAASPIIEARFPKTEWEDFVKNWEVAVHGAYLLVTGCLSLKTDIRLDSVVFILSSVTIGVPPVAKSAYITSKYALLGLAKSMAVELASQGVRVNCVSPGFTPVGLMAHVDERIQEVIARSVPMKRLCTPEDVAAAVAFLITTESTYVTGINLPISGGINM